MALASSLLHLQEPATWEPWG